MPLPLPGLPAVHFSGIGNFLRTCAEMAGPVALAAWIPRMILPRLRKHLALVLAGALVVFLAGGASVARLVRVRALEAAAPAQPEQAPARAAAEPRPLAPVPDPGASGSVELPLTDLPLQLLGTSVAAEPSQSIAVVADTERVSPQRMREGDAFADHPDARLAKIEVERVLIDNAGRLEMLHLNADVSTLEAAAAVPETDRPVPETDRPGWEELERRGQTADRLRDLIAAGPRGSSPARVGGLLAEGDPVPVYADGELTGIELQNVRPDGLYARLGLREGDVVQSINGVTFAAPDASGALLRELARSPQIDLTVQRGDGTSERISLPRQQLVEQLQALE